MVAEVRSYAGQQDERSAAQRSGTAPYTPTASNVRNVYGPRSVSVVWLCQPASSGVSLCSMQPGASPPCL